MKYKISLLVLTIFILQACSVVQATNGPESKDLSVLKLSTSRDLVIAEFGKPVLTETNENGNKYDIFKFMQGQHGAAKAGKAAIYGILAVGTLGLSEIVTSPVEGATGNGAEMQIKVTYKDKKVTEVTVLKDERWVPVQKIK